MTEGRVPSSYYCERCKRQVPAAEFDTDLWDHIACPTAPARTPSGEDRPVPTSEGD